MNDNNKKKVSPQISVNLDTTPILYTDDIIMTANINGIVLDVGQHVGSTNQVKIVTRIGMSREHAKKFVSEMSKLLTISEGKNQTGKADLN